MAAPKTTANQSSVTAFLKGIRDPQKRKDCQVIGRMMRDATGKRARMWGTSIVGYDKYDYTYKSGRSGSWPIVAYSPRAQNISVYIMPGFSKFGPLLKKLGKHKHAKSCLYIKRLSDVDEKVLARLINASVTAMRKKYGRS